MRLWFGERGCEAVGGGEGCAAKWGGGRGM